jgi:hypothetical protein
LGELRSGAVMIRIRHNDSRNRAGADHFIECFALQKNWIDQIRSAGSGEAIE